MVWKDTWRFTDSIEYEYKCAGKYGAKGEKRAKKKKATPEQIKENNQKQREKTMRRLIKKNFREGDLWATLKYPEGTRKTVKEVTKDLKRFLRKAREKWKRQGEPLKYVYRIEIGDRGGIHIHIIVNRMREGETDLIIQEIWDHGRVNFQSIYESGGYKKLAAYIVKQPDEEKMEQLSLFGKNDRKKLVKYSTSRNLIRPKPERKEYRRRTIRSIVENGPKPTPGFYIDQESIVYGTNPFTGMTYFHYTENRIKPIGRRFWEKKGDG